MKILHINSLSTYGAGCSACGSHVHVPSIFAYSFFVSFLSFSFVFVIDLVTQISEDV
jgi:hypothetical protein